MSKQTNDFQQLIAMVVELLEDAEVVESKMVPDPDTGEPREVDVYALIRGKLNQRDVTIAVECVDRSKKMSAPWVEMMYGRYHRLPGIDIVMLVSSKGFFAPAEKLARKFGYLTVTPKIEKTDLAEKLGLAGGLRVSVKMMDWEMTPPILEIPVRGYAWDDCQYFVRSDGSRLASVADCEGRVLMRYLDLISPESPLLTPDAIELPPQTVSEAEPTFDGERLYVIMHGIFGQPPVVVPVLRITFTAEGKTSDTADLEQTEIGEFDGHAIGTGVSTLGGKPARIVVSESDDGRYKALGRWQYEHGGMPDTLTFRLGGSKPPDEDSMPPEEETSKPSELTD